MGSGGVIRANKSLEVGNVLVRNVNEEFFSTRVWVDNEGGVRRQRKRTGKSSDRENVF